MDIRTRGLFAGLLAAVVGVAQALMLSTPAGAADGGHWRLTGWHVDGGSQNLNYVACHPGGFGGDLCTAVEGEYQASGFPRGVWVKNWHDADPKGAFGWGWVTSDFTWTELPQTLPNSTPFPVTLQSLELANEWKLDKKLYPANFFGIFMEVQGYTQVYGTESSSVAGTWTGTLRLDHYPSMSDDVVRSVHLGSMSGWGLYFDYTWTPDSSPGPDPGPALSAPKNLEVSAGSTKTVVSWSAADGAANYTVKLTGRSRKNKKVTKTKSTTGTGVTIKVPLKPSSKVKVCVTANASGESKTACGKARVR